MRCPGLIVLLLLASCGEVTEPGSLLARPDAAVPPACPAVDAGVAACPEAATVDVSSLLLEMVDLARLARQSCVPFTTREASSYDRRSRTPVATSADDSDWFANIDWGNYLGEERTSDGRTERVLLDVDGPGAIVHLWTANGLGRTLRIYLDGGPEPVIAAGFEDLLSGAILPFAAPFAATSSTGHNLDFPIPFRQHAKVTVEGDDVFYQVHYRLYEPGADVRTFALDDLPAGVMGQVAATLRQGPAATPGVIVANPGGEGATEILVPAAPGGSELTELRVVPDERGEATLRESILTLTFDGRQTARVPLGDFFGGGPGFLPHRTLPVEVSASGVLVSRFVMPFGCYAAVRVESPPGHTVALSLRHRPAPFTLGSLHFHARWIARGPLATRPYREVTVADVLGPGTYVGTMLSVDSRSPEWWGEGDEKIWIDDEAFPSWFGTGTEDYFGYANARRDPFEHAYRTLMITGGGRGQVAQARYHALDAIPFRSRLRFDLELWHWDANESLLFDTLAYFYASPSGGDALPAAGDAELRLR